MPIISQISLDYVKVGIVVCRLESNQYMKFNFDIKTVTLLVITFYELIKVEVLREGHTSFAKSPSKIRPVK